MPSPIQLADPQHLVLEGVSWDFYSQVRETLGNVHLRVAYGDGQLEICEPSSRNVTGGQQHLVLQGVSWDFYSRMLQAIGNNGLRASFHEGSIEIMSPLPEHEDVKKAIARLLEAMADELDLSLHGFGSTTFRREDRAAGLEPDECYYLGNEARVRGMKRFDPAIHPAPDLAIEVDIFGRSIAREPIYAALQVPELWRYDGKKLTILLLRPDGKYFAVERSPSFSLLPVWEFAAFVLRMESERQTSVVREFRRWVASLPR